MRTSLRTIPTFVSALRDDARHVVPRLRRHPSLAIWGGGNELDVDGSEPALVALREVVEALDPGRPWVPSSPSRDGRDLHGPWEHQGLREHPRHYESRRADLHSEFGVEGMTNRRALEALIAEEHRWPADRSNPVYAHLGAWWNNAPLVQACFGGRLDGIDASPSRLPVASVRGAPLRRRSDDSPRRRGRPLAAQRAVSERLVHDLSRLAGRPEACLLGRAACVSRCAERVVRDLGLGLRGRAGGARARRLRRRASSISTAASSPSRTAVRSLPRSRPSRPTSSSSTSAEIATR